jgi:hypothetical protein
MYGPNEEYDQNYQEERRRLTDELVYKFIEQTGGEHAYAHDGQYHYEIESIKRLMRMAEMAMRQEGIGDVTRERVIKTMIFGSPNHVDAEKRMKTIAEQVKLTAQFPIKRPT